MVAKRGLSPRVAPEADGRHGAIVAKILELAQDGNVQMIKLLGDYMFPARGRVVKIVLPGLMCGCVRPPPAAISGRGAGFQKSNPACTRERR